MPAIFSCAVSSELKTELFFRVLFPFIAASWVFGGRLPDVNDSKHKYTLAASFVFELTDRSRDRCNQYNATLCVLCKIENNNPARTTKKKGKNLMFLSFVSSRIYTNVRKIYSFAVRVESLSAKALIVLKFVFKVVLLRRWFRKSVRRTRVCPLNLVTQWTVVDVIFICLDSHKQTSFLYI